jgi:hypothetical protein
LNTFTKWIAALVCVLTLTNCATMRDSLLIGMGVGAAGGAGIGNAIGGNDPSGLWKGAVVGTVVGGIAAYLIHNGIEKRDADTRRETLFNLEKYDVTRPMGGGASSAPNITIAPPNVETECYETQVRGNKLIQSHCESSIVGTPEWVLPKSERKK